jgi:hypothetical protein
MLLKIKFRPDICLAIGLIWTCSIQRLALPVSQVWVNAAVAIVCVCFCRLYRSENFTMPVLSLDIKAFGIFVFLNLIAHWNGLFYSLGGDELYHADRAIPLGAIYRDLFPYFARTSMESFRSSMWKVFDPRHMNVIDLWRGISFGMITLAVGLALCAKSSETNSVTRTHTTPRRIILWSLGLCLAMLLGGWMKVAPEIHAPARLLPLSLSVLILGYNPFAFRLPGMITLALVQVFLFRYLRSRARAQPTWWHLLVCGLVGFIPVVFYSAEAVEPSIYGFATYIFVMIFIQKYWSEKLLDYLVIASIIAAAGTLCRQSTVITWALIGISFVARKQNWRLRSFLLTFAPFVIDIPYLYSVSQLGHHVVQGASQNKFDLLYQSLTSGVAIMGVANSTTLPWIILSILAAMICFSKVRWQEAVPFSLVIPAFVLFHTIWPYLWGLGRYQAEYVAPFIALALILSCIHVPTVKLKYVATVLAIAVVSTLEVNSNMSLDINYEQWPRMRITTSANFPYREALGTLKRAEVGGNFAIIGGSPIYNKTVLWLSGFSFWESARWEQVQNSLLAFISQPRSASEVRAFVKESRIQAIVVQSGTRREVQHREGMPGVSALIVSLEKVHLDSKSYFYKQASFEGEHGGILTIYKPRD